MEISRRVDILCEELFKGPLLFAHCFVSKVRASSLTRFTPRAQKLADQESRLLPFAPGSSLLDLVRPGNVVIIKDLVNRPSFNGMYGVVQPETVALLASAHRVEIRTDCGRTLRVKPINIEHQYGQPRLSRTALKPLNPWSEFQQGVDFEVRQASAGMRSI